MRPILEPNTNAQTMSLLSYQLCSSLAAIGCDGCSLLRGSLSNRESLYPRVYAVSVTVQTFAMTCESDLRRHSCVDIVYTDIFMSNLCRSHSRESDLCRHSCVDIVYTDILMSNLCRSHSRETDLRRHYNEM